MTVLGTGIGLGFARSIGGGGGGGGPAPTITRVTPDVDVGDTAGGILVTVEGSGFTGSTATRFGPTPLTAFQVLSDNLIQGITGANAKGIVDVVVEHPNGNATRSNGYEYFNMSSLAICVWWLRADLGITLDGSSKVQTWADQSGIGDANRNATQATAANRPAYNASNVDYNNKATVGTFNIGAANTILTTGVWSASYSTFSIGCVGHGVDDANNRYFTFGSASDFLALSCSARNGRVFSGNASQALAETGQNARFPKCVLIAEFNGAASSLYVNATETPTVTGTLAASTLGNEAFNVGCRSGVAGTTSGVAAMAEAWVFSSIPTSAEDIRIRKYLNGRYAKSMTT